MKVTTSTRSFALLLKAGEEMAGCLRRSMASDETLDMPYDEDAATALRHWDEALDTEENPDV